MKTVGYAIVGTGYFGAELGRIMKEQEGAKIGVRRRNRLGYII